MCQIVKLGAIKNGIYNVEMVWILIDMQGGEFSIHTRQGSLLSSLPMKSKLV